MTRWAAGGLTLGGFGLLLVSVARAASEGISWHLALSTLAGASVTGLGVLMLRRPAQ